MKSEPLGRTGKNEFARRATVTITATVEWHEDDFNGDLEALRGYKEPLQDVLLYLPRTVRDLVQSSEVEVDYEDIKYTDTKEE